MSRHLKIFTVLVLLVFLIFFTPFWAPISLAAIFAFTIHPVICLFNKNKKGKTLIKEKWVISAVVVTTLLILTPFGLGVYGAASRILAISQDEQERNIDITHIDRVVLKSIERVSKAANFKLPPEFIKNIKKTSTEMQSKVIDASKNIFLSIPQFVVTLLIFVLSLYIFLNYGSFIKTYIVQFKILNTKELDELIKVLQLTCHHTLVSLILIGSIQATIVTAGAAIAKYDEILLIFIITFGFSFIPVIGAAPTAFFLMLIEFSQNNWQMALFMFAVGCLAGTIDNIIKPLLLNRGIPMDGALSLIALIGSILVLGLPGLFIGPVLGSVAVYYFKKLRDTQEAKTP